MWFCFLRDDCSKHTLPVDLFDEQQYIDAFGSLMILSRPNLVTSFFARNSGMHLWNLMILPHVNDTLRYDINVRCKADETVHSIELELRKNHIKQHCNGSMATVTPQSSLLRRASSQ